MYALAGGGGDWWQTGPGPPTCVMRPALAAAAPASWNTPRIKSAHTHTHALTHSLPVPRARARHVKEADKEIVAAIKAAGRLVDAARLVHSYPYCWRSDTPLIYRAVPSWFVKV